MKYKSLLKLLVLLAIHSIVSGQLCAQVLVYEGFDYFNTTNESLHQIHNGKFIGGTTTNLATSLGWGGDWQESGGTGTYVVNPSPSVDYTAGVYDLITAGHFVQTGTASSIGRKLQNSPAGPFGRNGTNSNTGNTSNGTNYLVIPGNFTSNSYSSTTTSVGANGTTLWLSFLVNKTENNDNPTYISLHRNSDDWDGDSGNHLAVGYFGASSNSGGSRYWSIRINNVVTVSNDIITPNQWTLLVARINFNSATGNQVTLYVNPTNIGQSGAPASSNAPVSASSAAGVVNTFTSLAYYGGGVASTVPQSYIDELRIASDYNFATTASNLIRIEGSLCTGTLGNNIFTNGDFDSYASTPTYNIAQTSPWTDPPSRSSIDDSGPWVDVTGGGSYCYVDVLNFTGNGGPNDGYYTLVNGIRKAWDVWTTNTDYSGTGYLMLANAAYQPNIFFKQVPSNNFCELTRYEFSVQVMNVDKQTYRTAYGSSGTADGGFKNCDPTREPGCQQLSQLDGGVSATGNRNLTTHSNSGGSGCNLYDWYTSGTVNATTSDSRSYRVLPDIEFIIGDGIGNEVVAYSPPAPIPNDEQWHKVGFTFTTKAGVTSLELKVRNKAPGGGGNDIALDDFSFRACGPSVLLGNNFPGCTPTPLVWVDSITDEYSSPKYQWEVSSNNGTSWTDIVGATDSVYVPTFPAVNQNDLVRLRIASSVPNLSSANCYIVSSSLNVVCLVPLPATLLSFNAQKISTGIQINWQTTYESKTDYFIVERSLDGSTFTQLCQVSAKGNSNQLESYYCYDSAPANGRNYYRLKQIDQDGQYSYSKVVSVTYDQASSSRQIQLVPNPANESVKVVFVEEVTKAQSAHVTVSTIMGQVIQEQTVKLNSNELVLNTSSLSDGIYIVEVMVGEQKFVQKLVITK
ncbi:T9SS type A sorting domain-containing protein [Cytophagaceae bacterium YF14B1]|uniref:T9SS type A sorting domain-containing protein n=1 Tax=Xanthocytophaga flava TaxID=3048013 RepID=A0AAE3U737_9BACT|nr:T9SS type A sorting domain-containing protein [Xanthocytophaga flavus]MDJ1479269.1 T9SS type A sorting domain-containing protein [Xanthocytophaga flavus]